MFEVNIPLENELRFDEGISHICILTWKDWRWTNTWSSSWVSDVDKPAKFLVNCNIDQTQKINLFNTNLDKRDCNEPKVIFSWSWPLALVTSVWPVSQRYFPRVIRDHWEHWDNIWWQSHIYLLSRTDQLISWSDMRQPLHVLAFTIATSHKKHIHHFYSSNPLFKALVSLQVVIPPWSQSPHPRGHSLQSPHSGDVHWRSVGGRLTPVPRTKQHRPHSQQLRTGKIATCRYYENSDM